MLFNIISFTSSGKFTMAYDLMANISKQCCQHCKCTQDCLLWLWVGMGVRDGVEARQRTSCSNKTEFFWKSLKWFPQVISILFRSCAHQISPCLSRFLISILQCLPISILIWLRKISSPYFLRYIIFSTANNNASSQKYISYH